VDLHSVTLQKFAFRSYATWAVRKQREKLLRFFESKVLRKILCPVLENGCWRRRKISEIFKLYDDFVL